MSSLCNRRILNDLKKIEKSKNEHFKVLPNEDNIRYWKGYILPPNDSLYYGLILPFEIFFPKEYPE